MNYSSQSRLSARIAAALALALGTAAAVAQTTGASSSTSGATNPNRPTSASTSGAAAGSYGTQADTTRRDDASGRDRSTVYDSAGTTSSTGAVTTRANENRLGRDRDKLSFGDRRFVTKTADSGMSEVALATLASERASNPEVRRFAEKLVQDHTMVNNELTSLASTKSVKLDDEDGKDRHYKRLANKSGADFDEEFLEHMIDSHEQGVKNFEKASQNAKDAEVRAFASKHVGHLREHLQMAQNLKASAMPTGRVETETEVRTEDATGTKRTDTPPNPSQDYDSGTTKSRAGTSTETDTAPRSDDDTTSDPNRRRG